MLFSPEASLSYKMAAISPRIRKFWESVRPGQRFGFFDNDQCLFKGGIDVEEIAFNQFGLIESVKDWNQATATLEAKKGRDSVLVEGRPLNLSFYPQTVTEQIAEYTKLKPGTLMSPEVVNRLGIAVGRYTLEKGLFRPEAMDVLQECSKQGIRSVVISATPVDLVRGVLQTYQYELGLPIDTVLGTEDVYHPDGRVNEVLLLYGDPKTKIVEVAKSRGGIAVIGAGDKPATSDAFIHECKIKGHILNNSADQGQGEWRRIHSRLVARRS